MFVVPHFPARPTRRRSEWRPHRLVYQFGSLGRAPPSVSYAFRIMTTRLVPLAVTIAVFATSGCKDARRGQSSANESSVPDGCIVLLKRKNERAAFILANQTLRPERTDFYWYYRSDGKGTFAAGDPAVTSGCISNASRVAFSTFTVQWSGHTYKSGWVYFSIGPTELEKPADYLMCVTTETNLAAIDANSRSWDYRGRPHVNLKALIESQIKK